MEFFVVLMINFAAKIVAEYPFFTDKSENLLYLIMFVTFTNQIWSSFIITFPNSILKFKVHKVINLFDF